MPQTAEHFRKNLIESKLLTAEEIDYALADIPPDQFPQTGEQLARELIKRKLLNSYQAQEIYSGRFKTLVLGNYVVFEKLGQGGMGLVLKARHRLMKRLAAIKILPATVAKDSEAIARFQREFFAAGQLQHPNIVTAYDADESRGVHYLAMEYVDGKDLSSYVKATGPMDPLQAMKCILQAAKGLEYAHRRGVIHRDIKPQNLLIDGEGVIKILDMGLARFEALAGAPSTELTSTGAIMGTVDYMAPEQAMNTKNADARSDIYSLGATLWFLMAGQSMYKGDSMMARLLAHRDSPIPSLLEASPKAPPSLQSLYEKMVAKAPGDRFQAMAEVVTALEQLIAQTNSGASSLNLADTLYRDPRLQAFFENLEAQKQPKLKAPPLITAPDRLEQTEAISAPLAETKQVAPGRPREGADNPVKLAVNPADTTPIRFMIVSGLFGAIGVVGLLALVVFLNFPTDEKPSPTQVPEHKIESNLGSFSTSKPATAPATANSDSSTNPTASGAPSESKPSQEPQTGETSASQAKVEPPIASGSSVDLIAMVAPDRGFQLPPAWSLANSELTSKGVEVIENLKITPIEHSHYRVQCEFTLVTQGDAFYVVLPIGGTHVSWAVNAYTQPNVDYCRRGFASVMGKDLRTSPASQEVRRLIVGERHQVDIEVKAKDGQVELVEKFDAEPPLQWRGNSSDLNLADTYLWPEKDRLGCGVVNSAYRIHKFILTPMSK